MRKKGEDERRKRGKKRLEKEERMAKEWKAEKNVCMEDSVVWLKKQCEKYVQDSML